MDLNSREEKFKSLQNRLRDNSQKISLYKSMSLVFMILFIITAFFTFYSRIGYTENFNQLVLVCLLMTSFFTLTLFHIRITSKEKENRILDFEIYKLLRL